MSVSNDREKNFNLKLEKQMLLLKKVVSLYGAGTPLDEIALVLDMPISQVRFLLKDYVSDKRATGLKITIEHFLAPPDDKRWVVIIRLKEEDLPVSVTAYRYIDDAIEYLQSWVSGTIYL